MIMCVLFCMHFEMLCQAIWNLTLFEVIRISQYLYRSSNMRRIKYTCWMWVDFTLSKKNITKNFIYSENDYILNVKL